ncbi:MAG: DNA translocase FtsK [Planctomycetota bacterium]
MPDRSMKLDLVAIALAAVTLLLGFSVGSYDRGDPPSTLVWPPRVEVNNACGPGGAYVAHTLFEMMGVGAYYAVASLAVVTVLLLMRRSIDQPVTRTVGWSLSLLGVATLAAMLTPDWSPGPVVGAGGFLGAMGRAWLEANFAAAGAYIFAGSVLLAGLLMATDYLVFRMAATATAASGAGLLKAGELGQAAARRVSGGRAGLEAANGRAAVADETADEESEEDSDWEEGEWDEEEAESAGDGEMADQEEGEWEDEDDDAAELTVRTPGDSGISKAASGKAGDGKPLAADAAITDAKPVTAAAAVAAAAGGLGSKIAAALIKPKEPTPEETPAPTTAAPEKALLKEKPKTERDQIIDQLDKADQEHEVDDDYELPPVDLLLPAEDVSYEAHEKEVRRKAKILEKTFADFGFNVKVVEVETGPVIAQYEVELEAGLRLSKITGLADDLAIALRAPSVRIVAPIPGKNTVGIEVPNENRQLVRLREVIEETDGRARRMKIPVYLGKDVAGNPMIVDLAALPHLLIAGRTGTGKSVCLNSIIVSILMSRGPDEVRMLMIDPKMVELSGYRKLPHLMHPVVTDMKKAEAILAWAVDKMEERYQLLAKAGVRHVSSYNQLSGEELRERIESAEGHSLMEAEWDLVPKQLPFIVIVADEMADLMMTAGKDVEGHIIRLAQKSRAVGIHLILATQKPTVDVITGLIKSNLPARIAFQVASRTDSRVVLDEMGADKLLGNGDMLFLSPGTSMLLRGQGTYLSDDEITQVVDYVGTDDQQFAAELMQLKTKEEQEEDEKAAGGFKQRDDLYEAAVDVVVREGRGSVSLLQRCLGIGYGRAARLIDFMAEDKIVGPYNGSNAREVLISVAEWEAMTAEGGEVEEPAATSTAAAAPWEDGVPAAGADADVEVLASSEESEAWYEADEEEADEEAEAEDASAEDDEWEAKGEEGAEDEVDEAEDDQEWEYEEGDESESAEGDSAEGEDENTGDEAWEDEESEADAWEDEEGSAA